jgi:hypothetical protein
MCDMTIINNIGNTHITWHSWCVQILLWWLKWPWLCSHGNPSVLSSMELEPGSLRKTPLGLCINCPLFWPFLTKTEFCQHTTPQYKLSQKSIQWELSCFMWTGRRMDGQTDKTKLVDASRNVCQNMPRNYKPGNDMKLYLVLGCFWVMKICLGCNVV